LRVATFIILLATVGLARAEYRAYQYLVKPREPAALVTASRARVIVTTLPPVSYRAYYAGADATLMRTWMCVGYTGNKRPPCSAPGDQELK
jgi:hypothetical protein